MSELTPRITPLATEVINDPTMPAGLFQSYARLYAAAAAHGFLRTAALDFDSQVVPLLGLRRSQVRQHLQQLRFAKLLDWTTDGGNRYVFRFKSRNPDYVVGVVDSESKLSEEVQQQQQESEKAEPHEEKSNQGQDQSSQGLGQIEQQVRGWLLRAGVWGDAAARLGRQVAENESRRSRDESWHRGDSAPDLPGQVPASPGQALAKPGRVDVLGWMAYCFAEGGKNGIAQPAAVLAANLNAGRLCPPEYRPPEVCRRCGYVADYCECAQDEIELDYPGELLEQALALPGEALSTRRRYSLTPRDRWGVCTSCHALQCKCGEQL